MWKNSNTMHCLLECIMENHLAVSQKVKVSVQPGSFTPSNLPQRKTTICLSKRCTWMFLVAFFIKTKKWNNLSVHQLVGEFLKCGVFCIHTMEYYLAIRRNEPLIHAATRMNLKNMVSKGSLMQEITWCLIPFVWSVQKRLVHTKQTAGCLELGVELSISSR